VKKNIIKIVITLAIVAVGIAIMAFAQLNWSLNYSKNVRVEIYLGEKFEIATVANYIQEILPEQEVIVETAGAFKDTISFSTTQIANEQVQQIVDKTNEVFGTNLTVAADTDVIYNSNIRGRDIFAPYLVISTVAAIIIIAILTFIYGKKVGKRKVIATTLGVTVAGQFFYFVLLALTRIEINRIIPGTSVAIFIASMVYLMSQFEKIKEVE